MRHEFDPVYDVAVWWDRKNWSWGFQVMKVYPGHSSIDTKRFVQAEGCALTRRGARRKARRAISLAERPSRSYEEFRVEPE